MESTNLWEKLLPALVGVVGTLLGAGITFYAMAQVESTKIREARVGAAIGRFVKSSWAVPSEANALKLTQALTELAIYAPPKVVDEISQYTRTNCLESNDRGEHCKKLWISVLSQLRLLVDSEPVSPESLRHLTWKGGGDMKPNQESLPTR